MHGPFYWKSNNTLLDDQHFVTGLTELIDYVIDNELKTIEDARIRWDILTYRIRQHYTKYSKTAAEDGRKRRLQLESKVMELEARVTVESSTQFMILSNREIVGQKDVKKIILGLYSDLFRRKSILSAQQCKDFLDALTEEDRNVCEGLLTPGEVLNALKSMSKAKAPGNDRLTRELYIQFYKIIENVFIQSVNHSHKVRKLSSSQEQVLIMLI